MGYLADATITALKRGGNLGVFFQLAVQPVPVRLSLSVGPTPAQMPNLDASSDLYVGAGRLLGIPQLETLINGLAQTVSFTLSGLDPVASAEMLDTSPEVLGAPVSVGIQTMDARWQPTAPVAVLWTGTADFLTEGMPPQQSVTKNRTQTLTLTAISGDQSRQLGNNLTLTDLAQQALFPGDSACNRVSRYTQEYITPWPRYS